MSTILHFLSVLLTRMMSSLLASTMLWHWMFISQSSFTSPFSTSSRRMPGHIQEFTRLDPHSSHDLVLKIWRNDTTEATLRVFCLWLWVTRNQILMGTTGILISKNTKFKILLSINASLSDFTGFFALKTNQKNRFFCMDFHLRKLSRKDYNQSLQKSRTVPPDIVASLVCL